MVLPFLSSNLCGVCILAFICADRHSFYKPNEQRMKILYPLLSVLVLASACQNTEKPAESTQLLKSDTTFVAGPELPVKDSVAVAEAPEPQEKPKPTTTTAKKVATKSTGTNKESTVATTTEQTAAAPAQPAAEPVAEKKGWSKTAKGAVIGGVVGAGTGAIVNKKNRVAGAVIGGVIGAGTGAVIGNQMDKKDGRQ